MKFDWTILLPLASPFVNMGVTALAKKASGATGWKAMLLHIAATAASAAGATFFGVNPLGSGPAAAMALGVSSFAASQTIFHAGPKLSE